MILGIERGVEARSLERLEGRKRMPIIVVEAGVGGPCYFRISKSSPLARRGHCNLAGRPIRVYTSPCVSPNITLSANSIVAIVWQHATFL